MSQDTQLLIARPHGLVPGTREWLVEIEGPKVLKRVIDEIHAQPVGEMNPTGARLCGMVMDRVFPTLQSHHHTVEADLSRLSEDDLKAKLLEVLKAEAETIEYTERPQESKAE